MSYSMLYELETDTANDPIIDHASRDQSLHRWIEARFLKAGVERSVKQLLTQKLHVDEKMKNPATCMRRENK